MCQSDSNTSNDNVEPFTPAPQNMASTTTKEISWLDSYITIIFHWKYTLVIISWLMILIGAYVGKDAFSSLENGGFTPPYGESTIAAKYISKNLVYPQYTLTILVQGTNGLTANDAMFKTYYNNIKSNLIKKVRMTGVVGYFDYPWETRMISDDRSKVLMYATLTDDVTNQKIQDIVSVTPLKAFVGGSIPQGKEFNEFILSGVETAEFGSLPILFVLLIFALGGVTASLMPWYTAIFGIFWALTLLVGFNRSFNISGVAANIVTMFGLGLAIDYTLFIVSRFTAERKRYPHVRVQLIMKRVAQTSGKTVLISAATVFIALCGGLLFEEFFLCSICLAVMLSAVIAALFCNSFLYAQLMILDEGVLRCPSPTIEDMKRFFGLNYSIVPSSSKPGESTYNSYSSAKVAAATTTTTVAVMEPGNIEAGNDDDNSPAAAPIASTNGYNSLKPTEGDEEPIESKFWYRCGKFVLTYPIACLLASVALLVAFTVVFFVTIKFGVTDADVLPPTSDVRYVYDQARTVFTKNGQANIIVALHTKVKSGAGAVTSELFLRELKGFQDDVTQQLQNKNLRISNIYSMIDVGLSNYSFSSYVSMYKTPRSPQYANITSALVYPLGLTNLADWTYVCFSLPYYQYSEEAKRAVNIVRDRIGNPLNFQGDDGRSMLSYFGTAGTSAAVLDLYTSLNAQLPYWLTILVVAVFVILFLMTESLLLPLKAVVVSILSLGATFGILVLIFTSTDPSNKASLGIDPTGYMDGSNIIFIFSVAFGLSVDYEVFLLSRVLEEYRKVKDLDIALLNAIQATGGIITSASVRQ